MFRFAVPEFVTVMFRGASAVPWVVAGKERLPGMNVNAEAAGTPVPVIGIDCGFPGALSVAVSTACRKPAAAGVKTRLIGQFAFGRSTVGGWHEAAGVAVKSPGLVPVIAILFTLSG